MPSPRIETFAKALVRHVRDQAVRNCDVILSPQASAPIARRWRQLDASPSALEVVIPDVVDAALFCLLHAIDDGSLHLKFVDDDGHEIDLTKDGLGELAGWYTMGRGGWLASHSEERYFDDVSDVTEGA
jgi:hypothetical protein